MSWSGKLGKREESRVAWREEEEEEGEERRLEGLRPAEVRKEDGLD